MEFAHRSVMAAEILEYLDPRPGATYLDGTLGGGGHAAKILKASGPDGRLIGLDRDEDALKAAGEFLKPFGERAMLVHEDFRDLKAVLGRLGIGKIDGMVLDLGVSSYQLESPERGFSFMRDAFLDMRMDRSRGVTARDLVNTLDVDELTRIFREYGEEREARRIARAIERRRREKPVETTGELAEIVAAAVPGKFRHRSIHPATLVFQALRIAVNDELEGLKQGLADGFDSLSSKGRMVVLSFHSLEDRIVKEKFRAFENPCICPHVLPICVCGRRPVARVLTKKPIVPSAGEVEGNPRSRSAKLRAVEKL